MYIYQDNYSFKSRNIVAEYLPRFHRIIVNCCFLTDNLISVGKISFSLKDILGRGCEGTMVYKYV